MGRRRHLRLMLWLSGLFIRRVAVYSAPVSRTGLDSSGYGHHERANRPTWFQGGVTDAATAHQLRQGHLRLPGQLPRAAGAVAAGVGAALGGDCPPARDLSPHRMALEGGPGPPVHRLGGRRLPKKDRKREKGSKYGGSWRTPTSGAPLRVPGITTTVGMIG